MLDNIIKQYRGYWWLSVKENHQVPGILTRYADGRIILDLIGSFDSDENNPFGDWTSKNNNDERTIFGIDENAKKITLWGRRFAPKRNFASTFAIVSYRVRVMMYGEHSHSLTDKCNYKILVKIPELSYWCLPGMMEENISYDDENNPSSVAVRLNLRNSSHTPKAVSTLADSTLLRLYGDGGSQTDGLLLSPVIEQYTILELWNKKGLSLLEGFRIIKRFEKFLSFAATRQIKHSEIKIYNLSNPQKNNAGRIYYNPYIFYLSGDTEQIVRLAQPPYFLFNHDIIKNEFAEIIHHWVSADIETTPLIDHLVDSIIPNTNNISIYFLTVIQAIDGYWQRYREDIYKKSSKDRTSINEILKVLSAELSSFPSMEKYSLDIDAAVDSRNYYSHLLKKTSKEHILYDEELLSLTGNLRTLLLFCILKATGFSDKAIDIILTQYKGMFV